MSEVFDSLYGSNVGFDGPKDAFEVASLLLKFEQRLVDWQTRLPVPIAMITKEELASPPADFAFSRLRVILTLRFLNFRILTHRPLLCKFLEAAGSHQANRQEFVMLQQIGNNSLRICAQASILVIKLTQWALHHSEPPSQQLLGAWWLTLYYGDRSHEPPCLTVLTDIQPSTLPSLYILSC